MKALTSESTRCCCFVRRRARRCCLQQLGRGLRRSTGKALCTVLDFVANHRREFRYDRKFRALLGGTRRELQRHIEQGFPFLPSGCHMELEPVAQSIVLRSIKEALPTWQARRQELRSLGDVSLRTFLNETGLELEDIYAKNRSWSALRRSSGLPTADAGPHEDALLRAQSGDSCMSMTTSGWTPTGRWSDDRRRPIRLH